MLRQLQEVYANNFTQPLNPFKPFLTEWQEHDPHDAVC